MFELQYTYACDILSNVEECGIEQCNVFVQEVAAQDVAAANP